MCIFDSRLDSEKVTKHTHGPYRFWKNDPLPNMTYRIQ